MPPRNLLLIALTIVVSLACYSVASRNRYANLFAEAIEVIDKESLKRISREDLFVSAMEGMLKDLDEHSMYMDVVYLNKRPNRSSYAAFDINTLDQFQNIITGKGSCLIIKD